jgi:hypothetical protein
MHARQQVLHEVLGKPLCLAQTHQEQAAEQLNKRFATASSAGPIDSLFVTSLRFAKKFIFVKW